MIELRWVESGDGHEDSPLEKELQWRQWDGSRWTLWETVPTISKELCNV
jgi:hypothetical protein